MTSGEERNRLILELLLKKREVSFTDFEKEGIMAKSTLNDHLHELLKQETVRKAIGKNPPHVDHPVYVITAKGQRAYYGTSKAHGRRLKLSDF